VKPVAKMKIENVLAREFAGEPANSVTKQNEQTKTTHRSKKLKP